MFLREFDHGIDDLTVLNQKRITVHVNGDFENGKTLCAQAHWDIDELLNAASNRLGIAATRSFNADGNELEDAMSNPDSPHKAKYEKIRKQNLHKMDPIPVCKIPS